MINQGVYVMNVMFSVHKVLGLQDSYRFCLK